MGKIHEAIEKAKVGQRAGRPLSQTSQASGTAELAAAVNSSHPSQAWSGLKAELVEGDLFEQRVIAGLELDERGTPYRQLRTQVLKLMSDNGWTSLAVTSPNELAGKTLTATNLAIAIARGGNHDVILVDLDLRTPSIHQKLGINVEYGLSDYLTGKIELNGVLVNPGYERLFVLPGKPIGKFASELLSSPEMKRLMNELTGGDVADRFVLFDLPPLLRNDDALVVTPLADATLLIVEDGVTTEGQLEQSIRMLKGANLIGTVLNKARQ